MHFKTFFMTMIAVCGLIDVSTGLGQSFQAENTWVGRNRSKDLRHEAPKSGVITNGEQFKKLWDSWKPGEKYPNVDFEKNMIVIGTAAGPNRVMPSLKLEGSNLVAVFAATRMGGPGFGFAFVEVKRNKITTINGKPIEDEQSNQFIKVEIRGKLNHGVMAIGGETTGTTITANKITWELDLANNRELRLLAESLHGEVVTVNGRLNIKTGVEIKTRFIVKVESLK